MECLPRDCQLLILGKAGIDGRLAARISPGKLHVPPELVELLNTRLQPSQLCRTTFLVGSHYILGYDEMSTVGVCYVISCSAEKVVHSEKFPHISRCQFFQFPPLLVGLGTLHI